MKETALTMVALGRVFEDELARIPPKALEEFASRKKLLSGGYRPGKTALLCALVAGAYRSRLMTYDPELAVLLRATLPSARLLSMLSRDVLVSRAAQWIAFFGKGPFILALLMDPREEVRQAAAERMAAENAELPTPEVARELLAQAFSPIVDLGGAGAGSPAGSAAAREHIANLRKQLEEREVAAKRERREAEERARTAEREVKSRLATLQFGIDERQREIDRLKAELARSRETLEQRAKTLLAVRKIEAVLPWMVPVQRVEQTLAGEGAQPLLERAALALKQQALIDRASARRATLAEELHALEEMLGRVEDALAAAVVRHPELMAIRADLQGRIAQLRETLAIERPAEPLVARLQAEVDAVTQRSCEDVLAMLALAERLALVEKPEVARLRGLLRRRMASWSADVPNKDSAAELSPIERRNAALTAALRAQAPLLLFLDGHNVLNGLSRYKQRRGTAVTHEEARNHLARDLTLLLRDLPLVQAHLVWDGGSPSTFTVADNVTVHYSGGEGEHRADRYILNLLSFYKSEANALPKVLVSDDNDFGGEARRLGAEVCRLHDFEAFLNVPLR